ncbi:MAG: potassium channel family protein [Halobacteriaceae archaeon]
MALPETLPVRILLGVYLGVLAGILPALVTWALAVLFRYVTGLTVPAFAVVVLAVALAGVNGGFMAFNDPTVVGSQNSVTLVTALLVVMMLAFYTHNHGDKFGAALPRHVSLRSLRERTLSADVVELVGGRGRVTVTVIGPVDDLEGYPPLPEDVRAEIAAVEWTFPANAPLDDLESQFVDRLREEFDVADAAVTIDEEARATVSAAPPASALSRRVPAGKRAVSVDGLLPTGLARGDEVRVMTGETTVSGTVVSARSEEAAPAAEPPAEPVAGEEPPAAPVRAPSTTGGEGRLTVAVDRADADTLLAVESGRVLVTSRGTRHEYELLGLLRRAGQRFRRVTVADGGPLDGVTIGEANLRETYAVAVLGVKSGGRWTLAPRGDTPLRSADDLFVVGTRDAFERLGEAVV